MTSLTLAQMVPGKGLFLRAVAEVGRHRAALADVFLGNPVQFGQRDTGFNKGIKNPERIGHQRPRTAHGFDFTGRFQGHSTHNK